MALDTIYKIGQVVCEDCLDVLEEVADPPTRPLPEGLPEIFYRFDRIRNNRK